jgi:hypothetical protein
VQLPKKQIRTGGICGCGDLSAEGGVLQAAREVGAAELAGEGRSEGGGEGSDRGEGLGREGVLGVDEDGVDHLGGGGW